MAYNATDLTSKVQAKLDNTSFDTAKILNFLNDTNRQIVNMKRWPFMETTTNYTAVIGTQSVGTLPADLQVPINLRVLTTFTANLPFVPYIEYDRAYPNPTTLPNTPPTFFTIFNNTVLLGPSAPDVAYTLQLRYLKKPTTLVDGNSVPDVPYEFEEAMVLGAFMRALQHEDSYDQAQVISGQLDDLIINMNARLNATQLGQPNRMRNSRSRVRR